MQTNEQRHKDTYKRWRLRRCGEDESARESPERRRDKRSGTEGGPEWGERWRERTQRGVSIVLAKCGLETQYPVDPLDVTVRMWDLSFYGSHPFIYWNRYINLTTNNGRPKIQWIVWDKEIRNHLRFFPKHKQGKCSQLFLCGTKQQRILFSDNKGTHSSCTHTRTPQALKCDLVITDTGSGQLTHSIGVRFSHILQVSECLRRHTNPHSSISEECQMAYHANMNEERQWNDSCSMYQSQK